MVVRQAQICLYDIVKGLKLQRVLVLNEIFKPFSVYKTENFKYWVSFHVLFVIQ